MPPWTDPLWLAEAHGWIQEQVGRLGASVVNGHVPGDLDGTRVRLRMFVDGHP